MSFGARDLLAWIPVLVSVIAILVAKRAVTRSLRPVLVFVCEVRDEVLPELRRLAGSFHNDNSSARGRFQREVNRGDLNERLSDNAVRDRDLVNVASL
jgi:hypothetical protein